MLKHMAHKLPDGGANLKHMREELVARLTRMKKPGVGLEALQQQQDERPTSGPAFTHTLAMQARMLTNNVVEHLHKCRGRVGEAGQCVEGTGQEFCL